MERRKSKREISPNEKSELLYQEDIVGYLLHLMLLRISLA